MISGEERIKLTRFIWGMMIVGVVLGSMVLAPFLGDDILGMVFIMVAGAVFTTGLIWNWGRLPMTAQEASEKQKRDRLDAVLRDLSDSQLQILRERLAAGDIDDEKLSYMLGDDGELMRRR